MHQTCVENKIDIVCLQEPYRVDKRWISSIDKKSAIYIKNLNIKINNENKIIENNYVGVKLDYLTIINVYLSPNVSKQEFSIYLDEIENSRRGWRGSIILLGNPNARSPFFGDRKENARGRAFMQLVNDLRLEPIITEGGDTFIKGTRRSKIDIICASRDIYKRINSKINNNFNASDHVNCIHTIQTKNSKYGKIIAKNIVWNWNLKTLDPEKFINTFKKLNENIDWGNINTKAIDTYLENI